MIFGAVPGVRLAPWAPDEPVVDDPPGGVVRVPQLRFRDPAALEAAVPKSEAKARGWRSRRASRRRAAPRLAPRTSDLAPGLVNSHLSILDAHRR